MPAEILGGLEKDEPALGFLIEQDRDIAEKSGRAPLKIVSARRVGAKPEKIMQVSGLPFVVREGGDPVITDLAIGNTWLTGARGRRRHPTFAVSCRTPSQFRKIILDCE